MDKQIKNQRTTLQLFSDQWYSRKKKKATEKNNRENIIKIQEIEEHKVLN